MFGVPHLQSVTRLLKKKKKNARIEFKLKENPDGAFGVVSNPVIKKEKEKTQALCKHEPLFHRTKGKKKKQKP